MSSIEIAIESIVVILYHGYKNKPITAELWNFFPQLLYICAGSSVVTKDIEDIFGFEYVNQIVLCMKNYIARDPDGMMKTLDG